MYVFTADHEDTMSMELIEKLAKAMVNSPDKVKVTETKMSRITIIELEVAQEDVGQIIGKQGRNARAVRHLLQCVSTAAGERATLEIING